MAFIRQAYNPTTSNTNNCDSGVFMLKYVYLLMDDLSFDIDQAAISNYRNILALFISRSLTY